MKMVFLCYLSVWQFWCLIYMITFLFQHIHFNCTHPVCGSKSIFLFGSSVWTLIAKNLHTNDLSFEPQFVILYAHVFLIFSYSTGFKRQDSITTNPCCSNCSIFITGTVLLFIKMMFRNCYSEYLSLILSFDTTYQTTTILIMFYNFIIKPKLFVHQLT